MPYFLYKPQSITNVGGVFPNTRTLPSTVKLGLVEQEGYYLGYCENPEDILPIREYVVTFVDDETAKGFYLLGVTEVPEDPADPESPLRSLTTEEIQAQNRAYNLLLKLRIRQSIYWNVGDLEDLVADLSKRVDLLERLLLRTVYFLYTDQPLPDELKQAYLPLIEAYIQAIDVEGVKTRIDVEDPEGVFNRLKERMANLTNILKTEYLDKKR